MTINWKSQSFKINPYAHIHSVTHLGEEVKAYVVCKGGLEVADGKHFTKEGEAYAYARGLVDGGWSGEITIRYEYA